MTLFEKSTSMQIIPFPAHYQLVFHNFDFSSFSRISCRRSQWVWASKSMSLARKVIAVENHANSGLSHHVAPLTHEEDKTGS